MAGSETRGGPGDGDSSGYFKSKGGDPDDNGPINKGKGKKSGEGRDRESLASHTGWGVSWADSEGSSRSSGGPSDEGPKGSFQTAGNGGVRNGHGRWGK